MKHIGFLSFGHWTPSPQSQTRSAEDALLQTIKLAVAAEDLGADGGRSYTAEPDVLIEQLKGDEAIAEADTLLLTVPNQLGVAYNAHVIEAMLKHVAPALGWR
jgi:hypothetical protein